MNWPALPGTHADCPTAYNLRSLLLIRSFALLGQAAVLIYATSNESAHEALNASIITLCALSALTAISWWRIKPSVPVADGEFMLQLVIDIVGWGVLMYFTGGANNPFVSYLIVPLVVSAAVMSRGFTWFVGFVAVTAYSLLLFRYEPFSLFSPNGGHSHHGHGAEGNLHILGMWFNFLFSVGLIAFFVVRMASTLRAQDKLFTQQKEDQLRNDQILAVASLAAGTAHQLGTPLSTMAVLIDEMLADPELTPQAREDCLLLRTQINQCKETMTSLTRTAELDGTQQTIETVGTFTHRVLSQWLVRRPGISYTIDCADNSPNIESDSTLAQALENLLNNAADSGTQRIAVNVSWNEREAKVAIRDWGKGIAEEKLATLGKPIIHADRNGLGIGLILSQAAVERFGGRITLRNHKEEGAVACMYLSLAPTASSRGGSLK